MTQSARNWHISPFGVRPRSPTWRLALAFVFATGVHLLLAFWLYAVDWSVDSPKSWPVINATIQHPRPQQRFTEPTLAAPITEEITPPPPATVSSILVDTGKNDAETPSTDKHPVSEHDTSPTHSPTSVNQPTLTATVSRSTDSVSSKRQAQPVSDWQASDTLSRDPIEQHYQQQVLAHLRQHLIAPATWQGEVRIRFTVRYRHIATDLVILEQHGNPELAEWIVRSVLQANPLPPVPNDLPDPWSFSPTLIVQPP
ncbi:MAG: hypothetical protein IBX52_03660 [Bacterioplanes sp.]|nr:hypothetical protein [Bacterioplanes sp.]